jgi:acyl transferase domain-containing protein
MTADATARALFGMVARREITATQAQTLIATIRATRPAQASTQDQIAIIGMAGRFPGAETPEAFWQLLADGRCAVSPGPPSRWAMRDGALAVAGGWLEGIEEFDHAFFGIARREAEVMDPQQSLFLEAAWSALEQAGYAERDLSGRSVGVFVGAGAGDYASHLMALGAEPDGLSFMGNSNAILAGRIAYLLNLRGPCLTVDTACSSSLTAVHLAREALLSGGCEMAIAGGVCVLPTPTFAIAASRAGMLSASGTCRAFDAAADGFVPGEAVAALVLKPLARALVDGDHVWGVIEGSAVNQDGRTNGITAPSAPAQAALLQAVHERFGVDPATIGYVEAHGTGTRLGDPIEIEALTSSFRRHTDQVGFCAIGSVKSAIGHTMSAAGAVGIVKLLLSLAHRQLPPTLHVATPNPACAFETSPFFVNTALREWAPRGCTRRAAISAFGFSGSNVHMVIAEAPPRPLPPASTRPRLMLLSARDEMALRASAAALAEHVVGQAAPDLDALCWTLAAGRNHYRERAALLVETAEDLVHAAQAVAAGQAPVAAGDLGGSAQRFLAGEEVDPGELVPPEGRRRISLPGYPFRRVPCAVRAVTRPRALQGLHPLLDRALPNGAFHTAIGPAEALLADHLVQGAPILPGACIIGMALAASRAATGRAATGLSAVSFRAPVTATEAAGLLLRLEEGRFTLCAEAGQGGPLSTGSLGWDVPPAEAPLDPAAIRARLPVLLEGDALAVRFAEAGVKLGPLFRGLRRIWLPEDPRQGEALAELSLPGEELPGLSAYDIHPTLLDGAFQAGMAALAAARPEAREVLVPASLGSLVLHARPEPGCLAHITFAGAELVADRVRFHARLLDETGRVLATARDFLALRLPRAAAQPAPPLPGANSTPAPVPVPVFVPRWHPADGAPAAPRPGGVVLVLRDREDGGLGEALAKALGDRGVIQVVLGEATESLAAGIFGIDRADEVAFDRLLAQLKPLGAVYLLGSTRRTGTEAAACAPMVTTRTGSPGRRRTGRLAAAHALPAGSGRFPPRPGRRAAGAGSHHRRAGGGRGGSGRCRCRHAGRPFDDRRARTGGAAAFGDRYRAGRTGGRCVGARRFPACGAGRGAWAQPCLAGR